MAEDLMSTSRPTPELFMTAKGMNDDQELVLRSDDGATFTSSELISRLSGQESKGLLTLISGRAGVGKSHLLNRIRSEVYSRYIDLGDSRLQDSENAFKESIGERESSDSGARGQAVILIDAQRLKCSWNFLSTVTSMLSSRHILIATRPKGADYVHRNCKVTVQHFSIEGFAPNSILNFFQSKSPNEYSMLTNLLNQHPKILKCWCETPLVCTKLVELLQGKKLHALKLTLTNIAHQIVMAIIKWDLQKEGEDLTAPNLYSLDSKHSKHFKILCNLAFLDLCKGSLDSLASYSMFLSSFSIENSIASLEEVSSLGLLYHCECDSLHASMKGRLFWFHSIEIRDFLAAFALHLFAPLDLLHFLFEHAQSLIRSDSTYHGWLEFLYGLTVRRIAEYNPVRMMMSTLNELLVYVLDFHDPWQIIVFIRSLWETGDPSLWKKIKPCSMTLLEEQFDMVKPGLVEFISHSGCKEWAIESRSKDSKLCADLIAFIATVNIEVRENKTLGKTVVISPKKESQPPEQSAETMEQKTMKIGQIFCRAIREILQRVLQLYSTQKLKGDCSNLSFISFLNCECFKTAIEGRLTFEPILPSHFLTIENASKKVSKRDVTLIQHFRDRHDDKATELVILLRPCLKVVRFILPSSEEVLEIKLSGENMPETTYKIFVSNFIVELEEVVECVVAHEQIPSKTEKVVPGMPEFTVNPLSPAISLPPVPQHPPPPALSEEEAQSQQESSQSTSSTIGPLSQQSRPTVVINQASSEKGPSLRMSFLHSSSLHLPTTQPVQQQSLQGMKLANLNPGTVIFSTEPTALPLNHVLDLPRENVLIQSGGNGQIFAGNFAGLEVAIKKTSYRSKEYSIITKVRHENIVGLLAFIWGEENPTQRRRYFSYHVMPKMSGDLARMVTDKKELLLSSLHTTHSEDTHLMQVIRANTRHILSSVLKGLSYLHSLRVAHRDVKSSNVLLKFCCPCDNPLFCSCRPKYDVVLCDFDAAVQLASNSLLPVTSQQTLQAIAPQYHCVPVGTNGFRAPECSMHVIANDPDAFSPPVSTRCDVFSFGVLCLRLMVGEEGPYRQRAVATLLLYYHQSKRCVEGRWRRNRQRVSLAVVEKILKISKVRREMQWMSYALELVECCLKVDPLERLTAEQLLDHSFFFPTMSM